MHRWTWFFRGNKRMMGARLGSEGIGAQSFLAKPFAFGEFTGKEAHDVRPA